VKVFTLSTRYNISNAKADFLRKMSLRRYQKSLNRQQEMLLPSRVEDYVSDKNTVRAIDTYVDILNLKSLKCTHTEENSIAGQPAYDPAGLLKLYIRLYARYP
jgi:transposase